MLSKRPMGGSPTEYTKFFDAVTDAKAKVAVLMEPQSLSEPPSQTAQFANRLRERFFGFNVTDATPIVNELRQIKTAYEQDVLRKSVKISSDAHKAGMRAAAPGKYRVRSRGGDRSRLHAQRRHELGISLDRRQRAERHDSPLRQIEPADGEW